MSQEPDFFSAKELLAKHLSATPYQFLIEKEETVFRLETAPQDNRILIPFLVRVKNFIENFRIVSCEEHFLSIQVLPDNLFEKMDILDKLRIRIMFFSQSTKLEFTKRITFSTKELQLCIAVSQLFSGSESEKKDPESILRKLGADVFLPGDPNTSFQSVFGYEMVKKQIKESLIFPLLNPEPFNKISQFTRRNPSSILPRAVLFEGSPGVGKTTMAKIAAEESNVPLVYVPIETILSKYYGESSQNLAAVFDATALYERAFLFLDEIDSLATSREDGLFEATRNLLSVLLRKLDGITKMGGIITIGATNRKEDLDPALLSRFDRKIFFPLPSVEERSEILSGFAIQLSQDERLSLAKDLEGYSGRNLKDFCDSVERKWVSELILAKKEISAPPVHLYKKTLEEMAFLGGKIPNNP